MISSLFGGNDNCKYDSFAQSSGYKIWFSLEWCVVVSLEYYSIPTVSINNSIEYQQYEISASQLTAVIKILEIKIMKMVVMMVTAKLMMVTINVNYESMKTLMMILVGWKS